MLDAAGAIGKLEPLLFQTEMVRYLKREEPGLWKWFASTGTRPKQADAMRLDLLRSTYRIEAAAQPKLYDLAEEILLLHYELSAPVTFYQAQGGIGMNAGLAFAPGEVHVVFTGPVLGTLSEIELRAILAHELAHFLLYTGWEGDFLVAADLLRALCHEAQPAAVHLESLRLFDLYAEVFADRGALFVTGDPTAAIETLLKMETGLTEVSAESYLRQAEEILTAGRAQANQQTHPEPYIRARALRLWADRGAEANAEIAGMIEGAWSLDRIDLVRQRAVADKTRALLVEFLTPEWLRSESTLAHARLFFADFDLGPNAKAGSVEELLKDCDPSLRDYLCYVLLDFVTVDRDLTEAALASALLMCQRYDLAQRFGEIAVKELGMTKKQFAKLQRDAEAIVAHAGMAQEAAEKE